MANSLPATEAALDGLPTLSADSADSIVCVLFCAAVAIGTAWFYWNVMCFAQRASSQGDAPGDAVAAQPHDERAIFAGTFATRGVCGQATAVAS